MSGSRRTVQRQRISAARIIRTSRCVGLTTAHWPHGERIPPMKRTGLFSDSSTSNQVSGTGFSMCQSRTFVDGARLFVAKTPWTGVNVWDIASGEALLDDSNVPAVKYHRGTKQFWGFGTRLTHVLSRLTDKS